MRRCRSRLPRIGAILSLLLLSRPAEGTAAPGAFMWLSTNHWVLPTSPRHDQPSARKRLCHSRAAKCRGEIDTPANVLQALVPVVRGRRLCDVGCRAGDFLAFFQPHAAALWGIELDAPAAHTAQQRGLPVVQGDFFNTTPPADCQVFYFWITGKLCLALLSRIGRLVRDHSVDPEGPVVVVTPAEYQKTREMGSLVEANDLYNGFYLKVLFDEGDGFRQFGMVVFLIYTLPSQALNGTVPLTHMTPAQFDVGLPAFTRLRWRFYDPIPDASLNERCPKYVTPTSVAALRKLTRDRHFCSLSPTNRCLLPALQGHARSARDLFAERALASVDPDPGGRPPLPANGTALGHGEPCEVYFISGPAHVMLLALRRLQRAGGPLSVSGRQLVLAMEMGEVEARVAKVKAQVPPWCIMYKIPYDYGPGRRFGIVVLFVCERGNTVGPL
eukprot:EG_transcript_8737